MNVSLWKSRSSKVCAMLLLVVLTACNNNSSDPVVSASILSSGITLNPEGNTPLAAEVEIETDIPTSVELYIDDGVDGRKVIFPGYSTRHSLPVLGLKPNIAYSVTATVKQQSRRTEALKIPFSVVTNPLPANFPKVEVFTSIPEDMEPGYFLLDRFRGGPVNETYTIILDGDGSVVWYATVGDQAMLQLSNGNLFYRTAEKFVEIDMLGRTVRSISHGSELLHHEALPTQDGTILSLGYESRTVEEYPTSQSNPDAPLQTAVIQVDPVLEFDENGTIIGKWVPNEMLDPQRIGYGSLVPASLGLDWGHSNAVFHDIRDDSLIVSIRHQDAVVKFSRENGELIWILANHDNWPPELQPYLLTPVGTPFAWQYHQHAPMITAAGTLMLFDNGNSRASPFDGRTPVERSENFSRAVEYEIDEAKMEVRQVWEFGTDSSPRLYAEFIGDADSLPVTRNTLITYGGVAFIDGIWVDNLDLGSIVTRVIEVTHEIPARKVFDVMLYKPTSGSVVATYRSEKIIGLYGPDIDVIEQ